MTIIPLPQQHRDEAFGLLKNASLPVADIDDTVQVFVLQTGTELAGTIGWQTDGQTALLRSLSVRADLRGKGYGQALVDYLENHASEQNIASLYLLTTTARSFFEARGYEPIPRAQAPDFIRQTTEFSATCPASATLMKKELG